MKNWIFVIAVVTSWRTFALEQSYSNFCQPIKQLSELSGSEIKWSSESWKTKNKYQPFSIELDGADIPIFDLTHFSQGDAMADNSVLFEANDKSMMLLISLDKSELKKLSEVGSSEFDPKISSFFDYEQLEKLDNFYERTIHDVIRHGYDLTPAVLECDKIVDEESFRRIVNVKWLENLQTLLIKVAALRRNSNFVFDINGKDYAVLGEKSFEILIKSSNYIVNITALFEDEQTTRNHFFNFITAIKNGNFNKVTWAYFGVSDPKLDNL